MIGKCCSNSHNSRNDCNCDINTLNQQGSFNLECGSDPFKIFESDEPIEIFGSLTLTEPQSGLASCNLTVIIGLENGNSLFFEIPSTNTTTTILDNNEIQFHSQNVLTITIQCQEGNNNGCRGDWNIKILFRVSNTQQNCECPIIDCFCGNGNTSLSCGSNPFKIFESIEPLEIIGKINLIENTQDQDSCELTVTVDLANGTNLSFLIPNPNTNPTISETNTIGFYSKNIIRITLQCQNSNIGQGCIILYNTDTIIRGITS